MAYELVRADLEALLLGGCFFGSGGGGTVVSAKSLVSNFQAGSYYPKDTVKVVTVEEATHGESVMVAYMGAPEAIDGAKYPEGPVGAVQQVQARLAASGKKLAYVVPPESGALGFTVACLVAARLGLSVVDADGAGRAVPSLPMLTFAAQHVDPRPAFLVSQGGLAVELNVTPSQGSHGGDQHQQDVSEIVEQMMRPIVADPEFDEFGGLAMWVMDPATLAKALPIRGTLSRALKFGQAIQAGHLSTPKAVIEFLHKESGVKAQVIFGPGTIESAKVDTTGGFDLGTVRIDSAHGSATVLYQNESLLAWDSAKPHPICLAPDGIAYFVEGAGQSVFSNGDLVLSDGSLNPAVKGRQVTLLGLSANAALRIPDGLILTSFMDLLGTMGYHGPYVPVEVLAHIKTQGNQS
ncbi:DUF917 domain-containing protein [Aquabacterium sp.]|uniref:DUF917 domain-containing protein n=1 Tax=Aquabacterium sp. TaxID=1872578 RepID=UPI003D6D7C03